MGPRAERLSSSSSGVVAIWGGGLGRGGGFSSFLWTACPSEAETVERDRPVPTCMLPVLVPAYPLYVLLLPPCTIARGPLARTALPFCVAVYPLLARDLCCRRGPLERAPPNAAGRERVTRCERPALPSRRGQSGYPRGRTYAVAGTHPAEQLPAVAAALHDRAACAHVLYRRRHGMYGAPTAAACTHTDGRKRDGCSPRRGPTRSLAT